MKNDEVPVNSIIKYTGLYDRKKCREQIIIFSILDIL